MINKIKKFINYKLLITFLIILLLGMLYLGNYNLIEGNTAQDMINNSVAQLNETAAMETAMINNSPIETTENYQNSIDCEKLQETLQRNCRRGGGEGTPECETQFASAQNQYSIAVRNGLCSNNS